VGARSEGGKEKDIYISGTSDTLVLKIRLPLSQTLSQTEWGTLSAIRYGGTRGERGEERDINNCIYIDIYSNIYTHIHTHVNIYIYMCTHTYGKGGEEGGGGG
jgi:hypothetical protein